MPLRLLAGPTKIVDDEGNLPVSMALSAYYPGMGLLAVGYYDYYVSNTYHRITFDGVSQRLPLQGTGTHTLGWWVPRKRMVSYPGAPGFDAPEVVWEPKVFLPQRADEPRTGILNPPIYIIARPYIRLADRWLYGNGPRVNVVRAIGDGAWTEGQEGPNWPFFMTGVLPGRVDTEILGFGIPPGGSVDRCRFYDVERQVFTSPTIYLGMETNCLVFAPEWGILVSGHAGETFEDGPAYAIRVWSLEINPQHLSDPSPYMGTPKSGQIVTYRTQLTGGLAEPVEGELINWQSAGSGLLLDAQSTTDVNGYATARMQYRVGETGESVVQAGVQC
jgi:hypothetical protein